MSLAPAAHRLELPDSLQQQLHGYRRRLWAIKMAEALGAATCGVLLAWFSVFLLDRAVDTPAVIRTVAFVAAWAAFSIGPWFFYRWVWRRRHLEHLARLLSRKLPLVGDQLLGVIELAHSDSEQARSRTLCAAAIQQVAQDASRRDFTTALPASRYRLWCGLALAAVAGLVVLAALCPEATSNAWARFSAPWRNTPRYTFASIEALPPALVVPHGEPVEVKLNLRPDSRWSPAMGQIIVGAQQPVRAALEDNAYTFDLPPQIEAGWLNVRVGDYLQRVRLQPELRPELNSFTASVQLPEYLGLPEPRQVDVRGGAVSLVKGSRATFTARINRELTAASVDGQAAQITGADLVTPEVAVDDTSEMVIQWRDQFGLEAQDPFRLVVTASDDEAPSLMCEDLPRRRVVLDSEQLTFRVKVSDDFGVKQIGMHWRGFPDAVKGQPAEGERVLAAGAPDQQILDVPGSFTAQYLKIEPQPLELLIYAEDYLPGRPRVYSAPFLLYVLNAEQHAVWMTEQLSKWHRQSLEVRDRELQLHEGNKQLRDLSATELDQPENRRRIEAQASAERANGRRLASLTAMGEELVIQASRNPEFGVGHLEKWAEMLQLLKDIAGNRMPSVADLLQQAAKAESVAAQDPSSGPVVGQVRTTGGGKPGEPEEKADAATKPQVPAIVDTESSQQPPSDSEPPPPANSGGTPKLSLPFTSLSGGGGKGEACPVSEKLDEAIEQQRDLLAEFEKIADELNTILGNLEGSTLVKRLKAASREQYQVAGRIGEFLGDAFGRGPAQIEGKTQKLFGELSEVETRSSFKVSTIMDDMHAYFERRRLMQFKTVLDDMKQQDVVGNLRQLSADLPREHGLSIAQCEYWSDAMDRWAEDLVDPASGGT